MDSQQALATLIRGEVGKLNSLKKLNGLLRALSEATQKSSNLMDAMQILFSYWATAAIMSIYCYMGAYIAPEAPWAIVVMLGYVLFPDLLPGPVDDIAVVMALTELYISSIVSFARWVTQANSPPRLPILAYASRERAEQVEKQLWEIAKKHATVVLEQNLAAEEIKNLALQVKHTQEAQRDASANEQTTNSLPTALVAHLLGSRG